ncbi:MAG: hypothetical protein C0599_14365 [Salinivirgaceae bacterium]|nr:MAG: hypothetical protein C0599_14365 [Salinivirgaceae bacterium]
MNFLNLRFLKALFTGILLITASVAFSQHTVTGTVNDMDGNTLPGVNVTIKGTTVGTITDVQGQYKIDVPGNDAVLVFSFIGYSKEEITVGGQKTIDITLMPDIEALSEVLVIGYGTMKKEDKTGAVSQVTAEELNGGVVTDAIQTIQGRTPGVTITKSGGDPNAGFAVRVRGANGYGAGTSPLYVVDGVPGVDPTTVAPEDIKTFDILKDAASTAIYGSQGANGVIIITTKQGTSNKSDGNEFVSNVNFNSKISLDYTANRYDMMDASELRNYVQTIADATGSNVEDIFNDGGSNTDWQDEIFRTGVTSSNNISFSGGNKKSSYYASATHANWEGVMKGTSKERTIGKINVNHSGIDDKLRIQGSLSGTIEHNDYENYDGWDQDDIIYQALSRNPTDPVYTENGGYYEANRVFNYQNPLKIINKIQNERDAQRFYGMMKADLELVENLITSARVGFTQNDYVSNYFKPANTLASGNPGDGRKQYGMDNQKLLELTASYSKEIGQHSLHGVGGYSWQENYYEGFYAQGESPISPSIGINNLQNFIDINYEDIGSWAGSSRLIGFFGRVRYDFNKKYYASASLRRDGSSKFGENNKWGWFPTFAAGWRIDKEQFMADLSWLDMLKLRASYGVAGNQDIGNYRSLVPWELQGPGINPLNGETVINIGAAWNKNPNLQWEETAEINIGIDFGLLNNRISGSMDVYNKTTTNLLGEVPVPVPPNLASTTFMNSGELRSYGFEFFAEGYVYDRPSFKWKSAISLAHNTTKVIDLGEGFDEGEVSKRGWISGRGLVGDQNWVLGILEGEEIGSFYLPVYVTLLDGDFVYLSESGGYTTELSKAKRQVVGTAAPDLEFGWHNTFTFYDNWIVEVSFRGMVGNDIYNATEMLFDATTNIPDLNGLPSAVDWYEEGRTNAPSLADFYV